MENKKINWKKFNLVLKKIILQNKKNNKIN